MAYGQPYGEPITLIVSPIIGLVATIAGGGFKAASDKAAKKRAEAEQKANLYLVAVQNRTQRDLAKYDYLTTLLQTQAMMSQEKSVTARTMTPAQKQKLIVGLALGGVATGVLFLYLLRR